MFRAHITKVSMVLLLTLALGAASAPARAAGFSSEPPNRWEQLAGSFFGWLLNCSAGIDPLGGGVCSPGGGNASSAGIDPAGKAGTAPAGAAALCLDYSSCIDPDGRH